jgi:hypothetical protein
MIDLSAAPKFQESLVEITQKIPQWAETFKVEYQEIERQIGFAVGWALINPRKAPKKNVMRFLFNWFLIADRKGSMRRTAKVAPREPDPEPDMSIAEMIAIRKKNFGELR